MLTVQICKGRRFFYRMKATGIVRRIDELGRVVIPKEIRKTLRIKEGDPLEIYTDREDVLFRKYSPLAGIEGEASALAESLHEVTDLTAVIFDSDAVIAAAGKDAKTLVGEPVSEELEQLMRERTTRITSRQDGRVVPLFRKEIMHVAAQIIVPIASGGDLLGCVALVSGREESLSECELLVAKNAAAFLARRFD